jgi:UDP-N-acetylmuramoyl-tripeptide--D-alanyl-D-alanine ligase
MIIMDAYNANPNSMEAAISNLNRLESSKKVAILGDMFELGKDSASEHQQIAETILSSQVEKVFLIGENFSRVEVSNDKVRIYKSFEAFSDYFSTLDFDQTTFLIKASRGMALERVLDLI